MLQAPFHRRFVAKAGFMNIFYEPTVDPRDLFSPKTYSTSLSVYLKTSSKWVFYQVQATAFNQDDKTNKSELKCSARKKKKST